MIWLWLDATPRFKTFGLEHLYTGLFITVLTVAIIWFARRYLRPRGQHVLGVILGILPLIASLNRMFTTIYIGEFSIQDELPLYLCRTLAFVMPFLMLYRNKTMFGVMYFAVLAGTMSANITPDLANGFPHSYYFSYWTLHAGLVVCILYLVFVFQMLPRFSNIWRAMLWINVYMLIVHIVNYTLDTNYSYTMRKPPSPSPLDFLGDWPWYILSVEAVALSLFFLLYIPVWLHQRKNQHIHGDSK